MKKNSLKNKMPLFNTDDLPVNNVKGEFIMHVTKFIPIILILFIIGCVTVSEIHESAKKGDIKKIEELLKQGEDVNKFEFGTPLIWAAHAGQLETVKFLVSKGADVNIETRGWGNALCGAIVNQHWEVAKFLIYAGTDIERTFNGLQRWRNFAQQMGQTGEIINRINKAEQVLPSLALDVAGQFWREGRYEKVLYLANEIIKKQPNHSEAYAVLANGYSSVDNFDEAIKYAEMSLKIEKNALAYMVLGRAYGGKKEYGKAIENFKKALEIDPKGTTANFEIGVFLAKQEKFKQARHYFFKEIERIGANSIEAGPSLTFISILDLFLGNYNEAINSATKSIDLLKITGIDSPNREKIIYGKEAASAFAIRAIANREIAKKEDFLKDAEKAYSIDSNNNWSRLAMAMLNIDKGNFEEAIKILSTSREKEDFDKILEVIAYAKMNDIKKASEVYTQISEDYFETKSVFRQKYLIYAQDLLKQYKDQKLKSARYYESKKLYREALREYQEFIKFANDKEAKEVRAHLAKLMINYPHLFALPEEARKIVIRAETYTSEGNFEKAIEEYKKALQLQPFFPALYKALALNYAQIKEYKKAIRNMNTYLDLYPDAPDLRAAKDEIYRWEFLIEKGE